MKLQPMKCEQAGRFRLEISGGERGYIDHGWQDNLILDAGIQRLLGTNGSVLQQISVGSGTSTPSVGQTQLDSKIAHTNRNQSFTHGYNSDGGYGWTKFSCQFDRGAAAGNIGELGVGWDGTNLWSRALVLNAQNEPTTITVLSDEYLTVTYELRSWWSLPEPHYVDVVENISGTPTVIETVLVEYNMPQRKSVYTGNCAMFLRQPAPFVNSSATGTVMTSSWGVPQNGEVEATAVAGINQYTSGVHNVTGSATNFQIVPFNGTGVNQSVCNFTPPIPKTNEFEVTIKFTISMGRKS